MPLSSLPPNIFAQLVVADPNILLLVRELRVAASIYGPEFWDEDQAPVSNSRITLSSILAKSPNLRCWSVGGGTETENTSLFFSSFDSLTTPPRFTSLLNLKITIEILPPFLSYLRTHGSHLQNLDLFIQPPLNEADAASFASSSGTTGVTALALPNVHTLSVEEWNSRLDHQPVLDPLASWKLPSLRLFSFYGHSSSRSPPIDPEAFFTSHGATIEDLNWNEWTTSFPSFLPLLHLLPKLENLKCRPFDEVQRFLPGLARIKWLVVVYEEDDREHVDGFVEGFMGAVRKKNMPALELVLWRSGEGEGELWKTMVPWLEKLEKEEDLFTIWV